MLCEEYLYIFAIKGRLFRRNNADLWKYIKRDLIWWANLFRSYSENGPWNLVQKQGIERKQILYFADIDGWRNPWFSSIVWFDCGCFAYPVIDNYYWDWELRFLKDGETW